MGVRGNFQKNKKRMNEKDLNYIDSLLKRLTEMPDVLELRVKDAWNNVTQSEKDLLFTTYKELDDILNDLLAFINVKFPNRKDLIIRWNKIDFDPKIGEFKVHTNSPELIKSNWKGGLLDLKSLMENIRREIVLLIEEIPKVDSKSDSKTVIKDSNIFYGNVENFRKDSDNVEVIQNQTKKSRRKEYFTAGGVATLIALISLLFGDNLVGNFNWTNNKQNSIATSQKEDVVLIDSLKLPYLESVPIIDKGLFIEHYFTELIIGGPNLDSIKINGRKRSGERVKFRFNNNRDLSIEIFDIPYIEINYKGNFYIIEIFYVNQIFYYSIKKTTQNSLDLKEMSEI